VRFSPPPDLHSNRRLGLTAISVTIIASAGLTGHADNLANSLGDTDDAMRLVLVRDLMAGHGWYDQVIARLQPPHGVFLHWSRLLDGALATVIKIFAIVLPPETAELAMRFLWPLFWILPATLCALAIARRLGGSLAIFICAVLLAGNQQAFEQFVPGRIDHHNIQIVMTLIAAACAMAKEQQRWAFLAGGATGLGLAIGLEALPFHLLIGASYALPAITGSDDKRTTRSYALSLLVACLLFYCLQTPPWRWALSFCDAIGLNLVVAVAVMSCGLLAVSLDRIRISTRGHLLIVSAATVMAIGAYLVLDPLCIGGPLAAVDPRIRPFWFKIVDEMQPLPVIMKRYRDLGGGLIWLSTLALLAVIVLLVKEWRRRNSAILIACGLVILAVIAGFEAFRMESYVFWLGFPLLATGFSVLAIRFWNGLMVPTVIICVLLSPVSIKALSLAESAAFGSSRGMQWGHAGNRCHATAEYRQLQALPPGLVLADISMGPFILANTRHSVLNAPYHRMVWGILAAHDALTAKGAEAEREFRDLKVDYLVECLASPARSPDSIEWDLHHGRIPDWLQPLSAGRQALQIYRLRS
jgi:hypothetical protein